MNDLEIKIREIIKKEVSPSIDIDNLDDDTTFKDYDIDSLDRMSIYLAIEEEFGLKVPEDELPLLSSINMIAKYILSKK
ncbi:MAG: hypothetical protein A2W99_04755 [Bacteroidetes bacterium GWF2_33_16]|nr:MAG: hypothetical protein A2X00_17275 [Bacteroidetes bacterium GWE2_32_14]OFY05979.1 MAG: hypothetical protein A2W99_04755 [Bacteroidetes bacterium GWF2_33_16]